MLLYERYVDDSNQTAVTPPLGARYDSEKEKVIVNPQQMDCDSNIEPDEWLSKILLDIANSIMECIEMEGDWPSKNIDRKLQILDMK